MRSRFGDMLLPSVLGFGSFLLFVFLLLTVALSTLADTPKKDDNEAKNYANRSLTAIPRLQSVAPPKLDGNLDDPIWKVAAKADTFIDPQTSKPALEQTEVYLVYDNEAIYAAFYCHDSQPTAIAARETVRDAQLRGDDNVSIDFDPFLTYKFNDYSIFMVNPRGTRSMQISGGRAGKLEWQGDWDASAKIVADGWIVEIRIPWGILPYPRSTAPTNFGINFRRMHQRTQVNSLWSNLGVQFFNDREGYWKGVTPPANTWKPRLSFLPYLMPSLRTDGGRSQIRAGVDARYQPTPELTVVGALNPDFATVEGAVQGIFFSRSERFVPDRRPFFLEGADYFDVGRPYQIGRLFNPLRIQQFDLGAKVYGKINPTTTLGFLSTVDAGNQTNIVANVRRELGKTANVNFMMMQRLEKGADNSVLGFSQNYRRGKWGFDTQYFQSLGVGAGGAGWTTALNLEDKNFFGTVRYRSVGESFNNSLGFIPFNNFQGLTMFFMHEVAWRKGFWRGATAYFNPTWDWDQQGAPFRRDASIGLTFETRSDNAIGFDIQGGKFYNSSDFTYGVNFMRGMNNRFRRWGVGFLTGKQANLPFSAVSPSFSFRFGKRFDFIYSSYLQSYQGFDQQHIVTFNYEINPFQSWGGRVVVQQSRINYYLSYRNAGRRGTDFYVMIGDPNAESFVPRFLCKWVFAF
jgi:hypothetical protein